MARNYPDNVKEHTTIVTDRKPGFLERLSDTAGGMLIGFLAFSFSFYVLFTNEGRAVQTTASLDEGLSTVTSLSNILRIDPINEDKLVHISGALKTSKPLYDPNYGVSIHCVKLKRQVEMYQWVEYEESKEYEENGETKRETIYTYNTEWKSEVVSSRHFDREIAHRNPSAMAVESFTAVASEVEVGEFSLGKGLIDKIENFKQMSLEQMGNPHVDVTAQGDYFYQSANPKNPEVGDLRISFWYAGVSLGSSQYGAADMVSVIARQRGEVLMPYKTKSGDTLELLYMGTHSAEEMFQEEHQSNNFKTWALRGAGWLLMFIGVSLMTRILYTLVDWLPILRDLVSLGLKIFALSVSASLSLMTIAAGWFFYRPLMSLVLSVFAVGILVLAKSQVPHKKYQ
ncbi:transmembrane protein 43 [Spea bombifrons]|uniref:transmembrane protein 43 n=1 Tax=Spea bombifrons TaxID=233779 RepID=UPI0023495D86|nr:transmembrane protein 43 [Spea bombifrons]